MTAQANGTQLVSQSEYTYYESHFITGFAQVMEILESHGIFKFHFPGLESHGKSVYCLGGPGKSWNLFLDAFSIK